MYRGFVRSCLLTGAALLMLAVGVGAASGTAVDPAFYSTTLTSGRRMRLTPPASASRHSALRKQKRRWIPFSDTFANNPR